MPSGLAALLDDIATITKVAAASLDDVSAAAGRAGAKAAGVVIDDTAVTPRYLTGFTPDRELPVIARIAKGSIINKVVFILPAALLLSYFLPWAITPILMLGGAYLCFEGVEKLIDALFPTDESIAEEIAELSSAEHEQHMVTGAIRTDLILSSEIMAIALGQVSESPILTQAITLLIVAIVITAGVYGVVGLIVKMDDIGLHLAKRKSSSLQKIGRAMVLAMPKLLSALSVIGVAAMIWVGGGIILHGMHEFHITPLPELLDHAAETAAHALPALGGLVHWLVEAIGSGVFGTIIGGMIVWLHHLWAHRKH